MSQFLDRLTYLTRKKPETFSDGHGITTDEDRSWERAYRIAGRTIKSSDQRMA